MRSKIYVFCAAISFGSYAFSADKSTEVSATLKVDPVKEIRFGPMVANFEKTTLTEILKTLGVGKMEHKGDAGEMLERWAILLRRQSVR